jgi:hypothetical protein
VRETARHAVLAAGRAASTRGPLADPEVLDAPSAELVRRLAHLRSTIDRYVRERREAGLSVERVVGEVRCLVRETESCEAWRDPADTLMAQAVRWTIEAYYDDPELAHVPRFY